MASMLGTIFCDSGAIVWAPPVYDASKGAVVGFSRAGSYGLATMHTGISRAGSRVGGFADDFYDRFHITTLLLDLGNLISDQSTSVTIWNAYRRAWTLTGLSILNGEGITVTGQPSPPLQFNPLQERVYNLGISTDGPAQIDATITWAFSNGSSIQLDIVGQRIVLWNWKPDWSEGVMETFQWFTDVIPAGRGEEQRRSLRLDPRQGLEFTSTVTKADRRILEAIMWNWGARYWAVPLWFDGQQLAAQLTLGATNVPVNPTGRGFAVGELLVLTSGDDPQSYEVVEVQSLSTSVTLVRPTQKTWPAGTWVYPARSAIIENVAQVSRFDGATGTVRIQWRMVEPTTWAAAATPQYRSLPVLEVLPNWIEDPTLAFERKVAILDAGVGLTQVIEKADMPLTLQRMRFTLTTKAAIDTWKQRLWFLRGKQGAIWVPTWAADLEVKADIGDAALAIDVAWLGYTKYLAQDVGRRDIRIQARNGTIYYRRITGSVEVSPTIERLSIDAALGTALLAADAVLVSFMALSRSDSDQHEFQYFTGDVADTVVAARAFRTEQ